MEELEPVETMTPEEVGKILHKSAEKIRAGLRQKVFPFRSGYRGKNRSMELYSY